MASTPDIGAYQASVSVGAYQAGAPAPTTYTVTYDGNTNDSGTVPTDATAYSEGDTVTVLGNTGSLAKTGYTFAGWNTAANGTGTGYVATDTFLMGAANVTLYAVWTEDATVTVTTNVATEVNSRSAILQGSLTDLGGEASVSVYFEYGPTTAYGSTTDALTLSAIGNFSAKITDFDESTTYHFRAVASDGVTVYNGADESLTTTACLFELTGTPSLESIYWSWAGYFLADWSGNFITVGQNGTTDGWDYDNLQDACEAAVDGDIILCYGVIKYFNSTHTGPWTLPTNKKLFFRGVTSEYSSNWVRSINSEDEIVVAGSGTDLFFEKMNLYSQYSLTGAVSPRGAANIFMNRSKISMGTYRSGFKGDIEDATFTGELKLQNVTFEKGTGIGAGSFGWGHFMDMSIAPVILSKVEAYSPETYSTPFILTNTTGSFAEDDYIENFTTEGAVNGYGWDYGEYLITDAFLASHGY